MSFVNKGLEAIAKSSKCEKGENFHLSKEWEFYSPDGKVYRFKNLINFIRNNAELFNPSDVIWKKTPKGAAEYCNAQTGLLILNSGRSKIWKGWQVMRKDGLLSNSPERLPLKGCAFCGGMFRGQINKLYCSKKCREQNFLKLQSEQRTQDNLNKLNDITK